MSGRGVPFGLLGVAGLVWAVGQPVLVRATTVIAGPGTAPVFRTHCPQSLPEGVLPTRERPDGWTASAPAGFVIDGAGMQHGTPGEKAHLKPTSSRTTKRGKKEISVTRWTFDLPHPYETWLYCTYGSIELAKRVPATATECTVTVETAGLDRLPTIIICK